MADQQPRFAPQSPRQRWGVEDCLRPCSSSPAVEAHRAVLYGESDHSVHPSPGSSSYSSPVASLFINI